MRQTQLCAHQPLGLRVFVVAQSRGNERNCFIKASRRKPFPYELRFKKAVTKLLGKGAWKVCLLRMNHYLFTQFIRIVYLYADQDMVKMDYSFTLDCFCKEHGKYSLNANLQCSPGCCWCHVYSVSIQQELAVPERSEVLGISHGWFQTSCPCDIHIEAFTCSRTDLKIKHKTWTSNLWSQTWRVRMYVRKKQHNIAHLSRWPAAREEIAIVIAMKRNIQNTLVAVKHFLSAITMVNILAISPC